MKIEKVTIKDSEELLKIYAPYILKTAITFEYEVPSLEEFKQRITNIASKYPYLKLIDNDEIVGYAYANSFSERKAYDYSVETTIYLKENARGKGYGKVLYQALEDSLKRMGILNMNACIAYPKVEDETLTFSSVHFHRSCGFKSVGVFHNSGYKFNKWYDMIWMEKQIGEHPSDLKPVDFGNWSI